MHLPLDREEEKQARRERIKNGTDTNAPALPSISVPYSPATMPFADLDYNSAYNNNGLQHTQQTLNILANGDLLYMHSSAYLAFDDQQGLRDARWSLSRKDPNGHLFDNTDTLHDTPVGYIADKLALRAFTLGDFTSTQQPLTALNQQGRGVSISNQPLERSQQFDRTTLSGDLQPGWEVELYRNDELLSFQRPSADGRYLFVDVPLLSGLNILRLVFYGPYGQTREEVKRLLVSPNITQAGQSYFRVEAMQQGTNLIDVKNQNFTSPLLTTSDPLAQVLSKGKLRTAAEVEYGLLNNLAVYAGSAHVPLGNTEHDYASTAIAAVLADIYGRVDASKDMQGGHALGFTLQTSVLDVSLSAQHQRYSGFASDFTETLQDPVTMRTNIRADRSFGLGFLPRINVGLAAFETEYTSGHVKRELDNRLSTTFLGRASVSHNLRFEEDRFNGQTTHNTGADVVISAPIYPLILRADASYGISPAKVLQGVALTADYPISQRLVSQFDITRSMTGEKITTYGASLSHHFDKYLIGVNGTYGDNGSVAAGISLSASIGQDPRNGNFAWLPEYSARDGLISPRAFMDTDGDGKYTQGEALLPDSRYRLNTSPAQMINSGDTPLIRGITPYTHTPLMMDSSSADNVYLLPTTPGYNIIARPGVPVLVDFPVRAAADVEGTVWMEKNGASKGAANVVVQAVNAKGEIIRQARSSFDGYYLLELVPPGEYILRIDPEQRARLHLQGGDGIQLTITGEEETVGGKAFRLSK